ncbi:DUF1015 domain-containing protein [Pseudoramibacter sp.]|jgi:uncharacterized protein (DUF1015 family)|uniref:DUF1015 domain-containing protein n=1 Tax=Pseudoramibacter sp. TaxID=2034862 RepID=UPI0025F5FAFF|nr:DUF1015 family protein [Pseudoramibacter sp.]MCH4072733.1 DUF1015 family protein [Pseudoramibacter sp.]MCH4106504.1 DUF1015 family protein [Pseudoramibacter sp.]
MATVKAFRAIRPIPEKAADVAALPYDVYNREEAREAVAGKPYSFLRVDRPETTMDPKIDLYDPAVYRQAQKNLQRLISDHVLIQDAQKQFYLYALKMGEHEQTGLVTCTSVDEYLDGHIKKHELTRSEKEQDRIHHVDSCDANTGPIFLTYRHQKEIDQRVEKIRAEEPLYDFTADDGIRHRVWHVQNAEDISGFIQAFEKVPALYIADGHHRAASAVKVAQMRREAHPGYTGEEPFNYFLSVIFPDDQLDILDYNRVVKDLNGLTPEDFMAALQKKCEVEPTDHPYRPDRKGHFGMYFNNQWYQLKIHDEFAAKGDPVKGLDVSILQDQILSPILGIGDPRVDKRIDFVGGIRGLKELERRVHTDMQVAFSMYPTSVQELMSIADAGLLMPPKSTWFEPKLRSGLFIHKLSD